VRTWIGLFRGVNVGGRAGTSAVLSERIVAAVGGSFGFRPALLLLPAAEVARAAAANPFPQAEAHPQYLHLWFLAAVPAPAAVRSLDGVRGASERCVLRGKVLYLHAPQGIGRSRLAARAEALLGVPATARNWRTVTQLLQLAGAAR
jgi:uncharacterized protein (DUF1697 family)